MQLYHVDCLNQIPKNATRLELQKTWPEGFDSFAACHPVTEFPDGLSRFGRTYMGACSFNDPSTIVSFVVENVFEYVRKLHFPDKPSRFQSIFACDNKEDCAVWSEWLYLHHEISIFDKKIVTIETNNSKFFKADAYWRDHNYTVNGEKLLCPSVYFQCAMNYWSGEISPSPKIEYIVNLPVDVIDYSSL